MRKLFKILAVLVALIAILLLTNPSPKRFIQYLGLPPTTHGHGFKAHYWMAFTIYVAPKSNEDSSNNRYLGIFLNFFKLSN